MSEIKLPDTYLGPYSMMTKDPQPDTFNLTHHPVFRYLFFLNRGPFISTVWMLPKIVDRPR